MSQTLQICGNCKFRISSACWLNLHNVMHDQQACQFFGVRTNGALPLRVYEKNKQPRTLRIEEAGAE